MMNMILEKKKALLMERPILRVKCNGTIGMISSEAFKWTLYAKINWLLGCSKIIHHTVDTKHGLPLTPGYRLIANPVQ